jgi:hypothetical protein
MKEKDEDDAFAKVIGRYFSHLEKPASADAEYCNRGYVVECKGRTGMI